MTDEYWDEPDPNWIAVNWAVGLACLLLGILEMRAGWHRYAGTGIGFGLISLAEVWAWRWRAKYAWAAWCRERRVIASLPSTAVMWAVAMAAGKLLDVLWP